MPAARPVDTTLLGLVEARADGRYNVYSLDRDALQRMAREHLAEEALPRLARFNDDTACLRCSLVGFGCVRSDRDGGRHWLVGNE